MVREQSRALMDAISEVLETMCFSCPVPLGLRDQSVEGDELLMADARFEGGRSGGVRLAISRVLASALTATLVGRREMELTHEEVRDAFMEVTSLIAWAFLQRINPTSSVCVGELRLLDRGEANGASRWVAMDVDGHSILGRVFWEQQT